MATADTNPAAACVGLVLAGGRGARLGEGPKALAELAGRPMVGHVLERLAPQVSDLLLSVEPGSAAMDGLGPILLEDRAPSHRGPLSGLHAGLCWLSARPGPAWLLLCPCDAPFLPRDLAARLLGAARDAQRPVACARYGERLQPTFSLWRRDRLPAVEEALLGRGEGGIMRLLLRQPHAIVDWSPAEPPPFFNVNEPEDLAAAARLLDRRAGGAEE